MGYMELTTHLKVILDILAQNELSFSAPLASADGKLNISNASYSVDLADGDGDDQADQVWLDERTLTTGATDTLDLYGSLTDVFGMTVNFEKVKAILVAHKSGTAGLHIGYTATTALAALIGAADANRKIEPNGLFFACSPDDGAAVAAGVSDSLVLKHDAADGDPITYQIVIVGVRP